MSHHMSPILLVGCGYMGREYAAVLQALETDFLTVGRGASSAQAFFKSTGVMPYVGGLERFAAERDTLPARAIVAANPETLYETTRLLIERGVREILLEKPGGITYEQIDQLARLAQDCGSRVCIAYNRRFYSSVQKARELITEDGGVSSFFFEFTEWSHRIETLNKPPEVFDSWFLCNSTHVVDLAFYLGGLPESMDSYTTGALRWYRRASSFSGAGIARNGATFSYRADWESAGRWSVEVLTKKRKLILCPLEELKCQRRGTVSVENVEIDDTLDQQFKPGLYAQTKAFLEQDFSALLSLQEHAAQCAFYRQIETGGRMT